MIYITIYQIPHKISITIFLNLDKSGVLVCSTWNIVYVLSSLFSRLSVLRAMCSTYCHCNLAMFWAMLLTLLTNTIMASIVWNKIFYSILFSFLICLFLFSNYWTKREAKSKGEPLDFHSSLVSASKMFAVENISAKYGANKNNSKHWMNIIRYTCWYFREKQKCL